MRIGFDISHSVGQRSGLGAYAIGLLQGLAAVDAEDEFLVYSFFYHRYPIRWRRVSIPEKPNFILNDPLFPGPVIRHLMGTRGSARSLWGNVEIVHSNSNVAPELRDSRLVFTLFDTTIYLFPETHTAANYDLVNRNLHRAARNAAAVIAISEQTKRDAQRFLHIPADRLFVVYPAAAKQFGPDIPADEISRVRARYGLPREFVLAVGTTEPRKNLNRLLEAIGLLARRGIKLPLFVAGGRGWLSEPLYEYVRRQGLGSLVTFTGYVPENDLPALYKAASVFAYPSLYEGFGLPVLEAMACGTPTLTSNRSALIEAAGDAALLVNPESVTEIADGIQELIDDKAKRTDLARLGLEQSRKFSWEQSARQVLEIYRRIIKR